MYFDPVFRISVLDDGTFYVEMTIEKPRSDKDKEKDYYSRTISKNVTCKNAKEIKALIDKYLPVLAKKESKDQEFEKAFDAAAKQGDK